MLGIHAASRTSVSVCEREGERETGIARARGSYALYLVQTVDPFQRLSFHCFFCQTASLVFNVPGDGEQVPTYVPKYATITQPNRCPFTPPTTVKFPPPPARPPEARGP